MSDRPGQSARRRAPFPEKIPRLQDLHFFLKLAPRLQLYSCMSVLRTMSLIVGGALVALGGSALALFL